MVTTTLEEYYGDNTTRGVLWTQLHISHCNQSRDYSIGTAESHMSSYDMEHVRIHSKPVIT